MVLKTRYNPIIFSLLLLSLTVKNIIWKIRNTKAFFCTQNYSLGAVPRIWQQSIKNYNSPVIGLYFSSWMKKSSLILYSVLKPSQNPRDIVQYNFVTFILFLFSYSLRHPCYYLCRHLSQWYSISLQNKYHKTSFKLH